RQCTFIPSRHRMWHGGASKMRTFMKLWLAAGALALASVGLHAAQGADMTYPQGQYEGPPPEAYVPPPQAYGPPPADDGYAYPPPLAYVVRPPSLYSVPRYAVVPGPYYVPGPYWRGYTPHYAYGYGHWGHGYRRWEAVPATTEPVIAFNEIAVSRLPGHWAKA